jgi:hypothetical protein
MYDKDLVSDFLEHAGVKGMRWGVRKGKTKPQPVGRRNYDPKKMSNTELKKTIARMRLEQEYASLNKKPKSKGRAWVGDQLRNNGGKVVGAIVTGVAGAAVAAFLKSPKAQRQLGKLAKIS